MVARQNPSGATVIKEVLSLTGWHSSAGANVFIYEVVATATTITLSSIGTMGFALLEVT